MCAPIAVFAYNRPEHLRRALRSLISCDGFVESRVVIFCDGPRSCHDADFVYEAREVAREILGSAAELRLSTENKGLSKSLISGVSDILNEYGRVIVVEDDLELAPSFLRYMNAALDRYAADERVFQVSGHMFDVPAIRARSEAVMLPFTTTWGWGTWARSWAHFDAGAAGRWKLKSDKLLRRQFNLHGTYDYAGLLERHFDGRSDSWGVRWYWSVFQAQGLCVFPPSTLVINNGYDGSGVHGRGLVRRFSSSWGDRDRTSDVSFPDGPAVMNEAAYASVRDAIWRQNGGWLGFAVDLGKSLFGI